MNPIKLKSGELLFSFAMFRTIPLSSPKNFRSTRNRFRTKPFKTTSSSAIRNPIVYFLGGAAFYGLIGSIYDKQSTEMTNEPELLRYQTNKAQPTNEVAESSPTNYSLLLKALALFNGILGNLVDLVQTAISIFPHGFGRGNLDSGSKSGAGDEKEMPGKSDEKKK